MTLPTPMTLTLELSPEEHDALTRQASVLGTTPEAVLRGLIAGLAPPPTLHEPAEDPEEQAERDRERAEIEANVLRWRAERGVQETV